MTELATFTPVRTVRLGFSRIRYEVRLYFRQGDAVFFTFLFPVVMLTIFSVAFSEASFGKDADGHGVTAAAYYLPAMLAAGVLLSGLQNMGDRHRRREERRHAQAARRHPAVGDQLLHRQDRPGAGDRHPAGGAAVWWLPASRSASRCPPTAEAWFTFAWVFLLGVTTCAILGIGLSALPRSGKSASAVIIPIVLVLQFISGVYISFSSLPTWLQNIASIFPLKWLAQGMRSVFLPPNSNSSSRAGAGTCRASRSRCVIWLVVGLILARLTFRWIRKDS